MNEKKEQGHFVKMPSTFSKIIISARADTNCFFEEANNQKCYVDDDGTFYAVHEEVITEPDTGQSIYEAVHTPMIVFEEFNKLKAENERLITAIKNCALVFNRAAISRQVKANDVIEAMEILAKALEENEKGS